MTRRAVLTATSLTLLLAAAACSRKPADPNSTPPAPTPEPADVPIPPPPKTAGPVTAGWDAGRLAQARRDAADRVRLIALGFHTAQDTYDSLPVGVLDRSGQTVGLSWRVLLMPYVCDEGPELYKQFKLDEPWDSPHNRRLIARMPKEYAPPGTDPKSGYTYLRAFTGPATAFPPPKPGRPGSPAPGLRITAIADGPSNTLLFAEAAEPVVWTKPDELAYDPAGPLPRLGGVFADGFHAAFGDGRAWFVTTGAKERAVRAAITAAGGEPLDPWELSP